MEKYDIQVADVVQLKADITLLKKFIENSGIILMPGILVALKEGLTLENYITVVTAMWKSCPLIEENVAKE